MKKPITQVVEPFSLGQLSDALVIVRHLQEAGYGMDALARYLDFVSEMAMKRRISIANELAAYHIEMERSMPKCPECGKPMAVVAVNTVPGDQIGGSAKSMWICSDSMECGHTIESDKTVAENIRSVGVLAPNFLSHDPLPRPASTRRPTVAADLPTRAAEKRAARAMKNRARCGQTPPRDY